MKEQDKIRFLEKIELFSSLTKEELQRISSRMVEKKYKKNEIILHAEDTNEYMYIIWSGKVKVVRTTEEGKEILYAMHHAGDFFGEMSLIDGKTTPASVIAIEESMITIISKKDFREILYGHDKMIESLLKMLCSRLRNCFETIQLLNLNNATQRVKMLFLILSAEYGEKTAEGITINLKLTHQSISDMTGMTRETVTRVFDKLQKSGDITILENRLIRLRPDFLSDDLRGTI
ncbi:MAG TPA: Crp/Fnr family transcriptional regulator [Nitrospirae bacterium]|nr:global nitrogen regulator [bacterium BMS3Abin10]GBE38248.1 global nitrogen regulator [bacterium BMS3Bbin08]HDH50540.1 Crp/Fnr family transcriptional regulator [Nitrospirota bacterium]HDK17694.1 Crp/Fnr family transcriptional regulator [Nitrospirota bacterium]HDO26271.1 Crp/Fnr family transcriptional regulator [Nitrospirota bacterium]